MRQSGYLTSEQVKAYLHLSVDREADFLFAEQELQRLLAKRKFKVLRNLDLSVENVHVMGQFTVVMVKMGTLSISGVSKRMPTDTYSMNIGISTAIARLLNTLLVAVLPQK